jgi:hypothetical protein
VNHERAGLSLTVAVTRARLLIRVPALSQASGVIHRFSEVPVVRNRLAIQEDGVALSRVSRAHWQHNDQSSASILEFYHNLWYDYYTNFLLQKEDESHR